jgi:hypothetical protein
MNELTLVVPQWLLKSINKALQGKRLPVNKALAAINEINRQIAEQNKSQIKQSAPSETLPPASGTGSQ